MTRTEPARHDVELHLEAVLRSPEFRSSERSKEFLRFVVTRLLNGDTHRLHERAIGVDLLGRPPDYNPADDAIVRVKANEVRKRLARYYDSAAEPPALRIELPVGTYVPRFHRGAVAPAEPSPLVPPPAALQRRLWWFTALGLAVTLAAALLVYHNSSDPLQDFWAPAAQQGNPILICIPGLRALVPAAATDLARRLGSVPESPVVSGNVAFDAGPGQRLFIQSDYVGMGAAFGAIGIANHLARIGKPALPRIAQDVSFADLRGHPSVLLGGFSSRWTLQMNRSVPFIFDHVNGESRIVSARDRTRSWAPVGHSYSGRAEEDYAILARVLDSQSGQVIYIAAGITTYGTQSAAECLVDADCIRKVTAGAPRDWPSKSLEAVLHTRILGNTPSRPDIVAVQVW